MSCRNSTRRQYRGFSECSGSRCCCSPGLSPRRRTPCRAGGRMPVNPAAPANRVPNSPASGKSCPRRWRTECRRRAPAEYDSRSITPCRIPGGTSLPVDGLVDSPEPEADGGAGPYMDLENPHAGGPGGAVAALGHGPLPGSGGRGQRRPALQPVGVQEFGGHRHGRPGPPEG